MGEAEKQIIADQGKEIRALKTRIRELKEYIGWIKGGKG